MKREQVRELNVVQACFEACRLSELDTLQRCPSHDGMGAGSLLCGFPSIFFCVLEMPCVAADTAVTLACSSGLLEHLHSMAVSS